MEMPSSTPVYIALIGDIIRSRAIMHRDEAQLLLKLELDRINEHYKPHIASNLTITLGDEFQGLLFPGAPLLTMLSKIERALSPDRIRFGIGAGSIDTKIDPDLAIGADGPAYHRAREAVEYLRKLEKKKQSPVADIRLATEADQDDVGKLVNTALSLMAAIKQSWTDRQREVIWAMMISQDTQTLIADQLGIAQSSVQKSLRKGQYYSYIDAFNTVEDVLKKLGTDDV